MTAVSTLAKLALGMMGQLRAKPALGESTRLQCGDIKGKPCSEAEIKSFLL